MTNGFGKLMIVIEYIEKHKIVLDVNVNTHLNCLITKWEKKEKNVNDYYAMKNNHTYIFFKDEKLEELWTDYLISAMNYRVSTLCH